MEHQHATHAHIYMYMHLQVFCVRVCGREKSRHPRQKRQRERSKAIEFLPKLKKNEEENGLETLVKYERKRGGHTHAQRQVEAHIRMCWNSKIYIDR